MCSHSCARAGDPQAGVSPLALSPQITVSSTQAAPRGLLLRTDSEPSHLSLSLEEPQGGRNLTVQSCRAGRNDGSQLTRARRGGCPAPSGPEETFLSSFLRGCQGSREYEFPRWVLVEKEPACQHRRHKRCRFDPWVESGRKDPLEEGMATHSSVLAWRIPMDRGAWWATVHKVAQS